MNTLATHFTSNGFVFRQLNREGMVALFAKRRPAWPEHQESYEVVVAGRHDGFTIAGRDIPPGETMPSSETWGTRGWTFLDLERAKTRFRELVTTNGKGARL